MVGAVVDYLVRAQQRKQHQPDRRGIVKPVDADEDVGDAAAHFPDLPEPRPGLPVDGGHGDDVPHATS